MSKSKSGKCPNCGEKLTDFDISEDSPTMRCRKCRFEFDPRSVFSDSDILFLAAALPSDRRDQLLANLGFEKKPIVRTPKILVMLLIAFFALGAVLLSIFKFFESQSVWRSTLVFLAFCSLIFFILQTYKDEKKLNWRRKRKND